MFYAHKVITNTVNERSLPHMFQIQIELLAKVNYLFKISNLN